MKKVMYSFRSTFVIFGLLSLVTGVLYPLLVTAIAQIVFPHQANGSLIASSGGEPTGSELIGQPFDDPRYFWGRPSVTAMQPYNASASSGSNQGPTNPSLEKAVQVRIQALHEADPANNAPVPVDLVTASGSGLDPHISPSAAQYQVPRVARLRGLDETTLRALVEQFTQLPQLGILGEARVNVLQLNLALNDLQAELQSK